MTFESIHSKTIIASIIIPTFKRPSNLSKAVMSVLKQEFNNFEIIVVDDNDPESNWRYETQKAMDQFIHDKRVFYIKHPKNINGAAARNTGLNISRGNYILFLDDDDEFLDGKIKAQVDFLEKSHLYNGVYTGTIRNGIINHPTLFGNLSYQLLCQKTEMYTPTLAFKREALVKIGGFDESYKRHQDYELLLRFFKHGYLMGVITTPYVKLGSNDGENILNSLEFELLKKKFISDFQLEINNFHASKKNKILSIHYYALFESFAKELQIKKMLEYFIKSFCLSPISVISMFYKRSILRLKSSL